MSKKLLLLFITTFSFLTSAFSQFDVKEKMTNLSEDINDGKISLSVSGGEFPYEYFWSNSSTPLTSHFAEKLTEGVEYSVTITDANGVKTEKKYIVETESFQEDINNAFIPVVYSDSMNNMYIMNRASNLSSTILQEISNFYENYKEYARSQGVETSIFDYFNNDGARNLNENISSFIRALEQQVKNTGIGDFELSLDFKPDNIMSWNGNLVMVDW